MDAERPSSCSASRCTAAGTASLEAYATLCATHVAAALADVRQLDEERRRRQALVELDAAKSAFFTNLSHELRTPLTLIAGPVQEALGPAPTTPASASDSSSSSATPHRLARMVDAMLDFGRIEAGGLVPRLEAGRPLRAHDGAGRELPARRCERAGLTFTHDCGDGVEAHLDRDMVERIVLNLLDQRREVHPRGLGRT